jgi:hypothetical protein
MRYSAVVGACRSESEWCHEPSKEECRCHTPGHYFAVTSARTAIINLEGHEYLLPEIDCLDQGTQRLGLKMWLPLGIGWQLNLFLLHRTDRTS